MVVVMVQMHKVCEAYGERYEDYNGKDGIHIIFPL